MLKTYKWNGRLWQFEEESAPEGAVEVVSCDADSQPALDSHAVDSGESVATSEDGKGAADPADDADAAANSDGDDPSADDAVKESKDGEDEGCKIEKQPARKQATKPNKQARANTK